MAMAKCPNCYHQIDLPDDLAPGAWMTCPACQTELVRNAGLGAGLSYAYIEQDMMWDDDDLDDDDDDDDWGL